MTGSDRFTTRITLLIFIMPGFVLAMLLLFLSGERNPHLKVILTLGIIWMTVLAAVIHRKITGNFRSQWGPKPTPLWLWYFIQQP